MKIEEFWNQAFLAALCRLPTEEAKLEAEKATQACIRYWQGHIFDRADYAIKWQDQDIASVPRCWPADRKNNPSDM
jgi:hypothetical protein